MSRPTTHPLLAELEREFAEAAPLSWDKILQRILAVVGCELGTIHLLGTTDGLLHLAAAHDLPPPVLEKVRLIPVGKGMAGLAALRREAVQVCNLQQEQVVVRPGAKLTKAEGSIACPMLVGNALLGVLGVAKRVPYDFSASETEFLMEIAATLGRCLQAQTQA